MDERIKDAVKYIAEHLHENMELKDVAKTAFLSPSHFHRLFRDEFGMTLKKFIDFYKLQKAFDVITDHSSPHSVMDITFMLGYKNYETFSRAFKRQFKVAPDDLKAIIQQAVTGMSGIDTEGNIVRKIVKIQAREDANMPEIMEQLAKDKGLQDVDQHEVHVTRIIAVEAANADVPLFKGTPVVIKKKFAMNDMSSEWSGLVTRLRTEKLL